MLSLTFDDAVPSQLDVAIPMLERYSVRGTFYVSVGPLRQRKAEWVQAAVNGHEIGNHTAHHPCSGNFGFIGENRLEDYTIERITEDIELANRAIEEAIGKAPKTFAYPCGQKFVGRGRGVRSYVPVVAERFLAGRGYRDESHNVVGRCDLAQLFASGIDGFPFEEIRRQIDHCIDEGGWLILGIHGVDVGHHLVTSSEVLENVLKHAKERGVRIETVEKTAMLLLEEPILHQDNHSIETGFDGGF